MPAYLRLLTLALSYRTSSVSVRHFSPCVYVCVCSAYDGPLSYPRVPARRPAVTRVSQTRRTRPPPSPRPPCSGSRRRHPARGTRRSARHLSLSPSRSPSRRPLSPSRSRRRHRQRRSTRTPPTVSGGWFTVDGERVSWPLCWRLFCSAACSHVVKCLVFVLTPPYQLDLPLLTGHSFGRLWSQFDHMLRSTMTVPSAITAVPDPIASYLTPPPVLCLRPPPPCSADLTRETPN